MFKAKEIKTNQIVQILDTYCDEYGKTWFLIWENDGWRWRAASAYCPPNYNPKKKIIVAGSRTFNNFPLLKEVLDKRVNEIKEVVSGRAKGADTFGETWALKNNIPIKPFAAQWEKFGAAAGYVRNHDMGDYADELIAFWDGNSSGTKDMIEYMEKLKKPVQVVKF